MSDFETRCYILPSSHGKAIGADRAHLAIGWPDDIIAEYMSAAGLDVAPGVRIVALSTGDHWHPPAGKTVHGVLVAARTPARPRPLPAELPLPEDYVRELQAEEIRLKAEHLRIGQRLHEIDVALVASGEARLKQRQAAGNP